jgi:hypothetical protein
MRKFRPPVRWDKYIESLERPVAQNLLADTIASRMSERALRLTLFYADILTRIPLRLDNKHARVLDIGSKDFAYAPALGSFLSDRALSFELTGLEMDPYPLYSNFFRRGDLGKYYAQLCNDEFPQGRVNYQGGNWLRYKTCGHLQLVTSFFPFLYEDLHSRFGLPSRGYWPVAYYDKAIRASEHCLFFHQGEEELLISKKILSATPQTKIIFEMEIEKSPWMERKFSTHVILTENFL